MDFDLRFVELMHTYRIDRHHPWFYEKVRAEQLLKEFWTEWSRENKGKTLTLLYEKKGDFENFCMSIPDGIRYKTVMYRNDNMFSVSECISQMEEDSTEDILLITQKDHVRISMELEREGLMIRDLYDYFATHGLELLHEYYLVSNEKYFDAAGKVDEDSWQNNRYETLFYDKRKYRTAQNKAQEEYYLERVIFDDYYMRDFANGEIYLKEYLGRKTDAVAEYEAFFSEVSGLLLELRQVIARKKEKDIVMYWLDAFSYEEDAKLLYWHSVNKDALVFKRSFAINNVTRNIIRALFCQKMPAETLGKSKQTEDAPLIDMLAERGWKFQYYGIERVFAKKYTRTVAEEEYHLVSSESYWKMVCDMAESAEPAFRLIHLMGMHPPYLSAEIDGERFIPLHDAYCSPGEEIQKARKQQRISAMQYEDRQLAFYDTLINVQAAIYFSDHGCIEYTTDNYAVLHHNILKVKSERIKPGVNKQIFSPLDFQKLIQKLIGGGAWDLDGISSGYVFLQNFPIYNKDYVKTFYSQTRFEEHMLGYNGIVKDDYIFFYFHAGYDLCYKLQEERIYLMGVNESRDIREQLLKEIRSTDRLLWDFSHEKFKYSQFLLQVRDAANKREDLRKNQQEGELFCRKFLEKYPEQSTFAIRGGGDDTVLFLDALSEGQRQKIKYIVDGNMQCNASRWGIPVTQPSQQEWKKVTHVIVISSNYREQMLSELANEPQITAIDLYRQLWDAGFEKRRTLVDILYRKRRTYAEEDFQLIDWREME